MKSFEPGAFAKVGGLLLDLLYPSICELCETPVKSGRSLCDACDGVLPRLVEPFCSKCGEHFEGWIEDSFVCPNCSHLSFAFEFARPAMVLDEKTRKLVLGLKYGRRIYLSNELARLAAEAFEDERFAPALAGKWPLVPVPLHRSRFQQRHFNQAAEIARSVSKRTGLPILHALRRTRATGTQTLLSRHQRLENLKGAFKAGRAAQKWRDKAGAVLIDDVLTTGSTVDACAKVLRAAGFRRIFVATVMRG